MKNWSEQDALELTSKLERKHPNNTRIMTGVQEAREVLSKPVKPMLAFSSQASQSKPVKQALQPVRATVQAKTKQPKLELTPEQELAKLEQQYYLNSIILEQYQVAREHHHQKQLFLWCEIQVRLELELFSELAWLYAIPNGTYASKASSGKAKAEGLKEGYPDIGLDLARHGYHGLRIELKKPGTEIQPNKRGRLRPKQRVWLEHLKSHGYLALECVGWQEALERLLWYVYA